jgi:GTP:adenosylcobinamide-phosphate guanylyltransferase
LEHHLNAPVVSNIIAKQLHVIVQAGGRGSRLRHHTWNKPKCLVSVRGKPILYHLFDQFAGARFWIIGDYLFEQLERYLQVSPPGVDYTLIRANEKGTAAGVGSAIAQIPAVDPVVITWSDLIIGALPPWPETTVPVVCTTSSFTCRWTAAPEGHLHEKPGSKDGIVGLFYLPQAETLAHVPDKGEFVKWFADNVPAFELLDCADLEELGDFATIEEDNDRSGFSRFFNKVEIGDTLVTKTVIDANYENVHVNEVAWYRKAKALGFRRIPKVHAETPLVLDRIFGHHAYQMHDLSNRERRAVMADYLDSLIALHDLDEGVADPQEVSAVYIEKTIARVRSVAPIIPGFDAPSMTINGKKCRNVFAEKHEGFLQSLLPMLQPKRFVPIHGDPTFSNTIVDDKLRVWFIDPRGYFHRPGIFGDALYDFAKVYYSAVGGYDAFNRRKFKLYIDNETIEILTEEPLFAKITNEIFSDYLGSDRAKVEVLHGLIWLALTGYARDDVDSVIGAFYLGLYWLETGTDRL